MKKEKKRQRVIQGAVVCVLVILVIVVCANTKKEKIIEFGMFTGSNWGVENADAFVLVDRAIGRFEARHPNVKVTYTSGIDKADYSEWCAKRMLQGELPDVFMISDTDFNQYCSLGILQELDSYMENDADFEKEKMFSTALEIGQGMEGTQYALPYEVVPTLLFVNRTLLRQEGIDMPSKDWSWEEFFEICRKVTKDTDGDGRINQFGTFNYTWLEAMYTSGGNVFDSQKQRVDFTNKYMKDSLKFMKELNRLNNGENVTQEDFDAGNVAFMPLTFAEYRTYKTYPYRIKKYANFQWDCTTFPAKIKGQNVSKVDALLLGISKDTEEKRLAWEFLKELTCTKESQMDIFQYSQGVSVLKDVAKSAEAEQIMQGEMDKGDQVISGEILCDVIDNGVIAPKFLQNEQYEQVVGLANTEIMEIFEQNKDSESSMKILQRKIEQYLNR